MIELNETHDARLKSWLTSANSDSNFPIQNLPLCIFRRKNSQEALRAGVGIGDMVIDMQAVLAKRIFSGLDEKANFSLVNEHLNRFMSMGQSVTTELRLALSRALREGSSQQPLLETCLVPQADIELHLPCKIGDYTDFYSSINHATSVGKLFRPENPLLPNYQWIPVAYHGRASSINVSGKALHRPWGQVKTAEAQSPQLLATKRLDYEVELGVWVGKSTKQFAPVPIAQAEQHIFGVCLLNDWSARDIQAWEYQPLGPFLSKNFMTSISPWVVTLEALAPYRTHLERDESAPAPLDYLSCEFNRQYGAVDIKLECYIQTAKMRSQKQPAVRLSQTNFKHAFWTMAQMLTHHSISGCNLNAGDLIGSGTQSGLQPEEAGSLLELTEGGKRPLTLPNGEERVFLEDGDEIELRGFCQHDNGPRIGLGSVNTMVKPAISLTHNRELQRASL